MRIKREIVEQLKAYKNAVYPTGRLFVFGSRADDTKRGGDIDLLLLTEKKISFTEKSKMRILLWKKFGEQKIDILNYTFDEENTFRELIEDECIEI